MTNPERKKTWSRHGVAGRMPHTPNPERRALRAKLRAENQALPLEKRKTARQIEKWINETFAGTRVSWMQEQV